MDDCCDVAGGGGGGASSKKWQWNDIMVSLSLSEKKTT